MASRLCALVVLLMWLTGCGPQSANAPKFLNTDVTGADFGKALLRRAPRKAHASLDYRFDGGLTLGWDVDAVSARPDLDFNVFPTERIDLGGYTLLSVRAALPLASGWQLEARIENLADHDYALARGYNTPGRSGMLGLRWEGQ